MSAAKHQFAYYPLTHFDFVWSTVGHTVGWLVEGILDKEKLDSALHRIVEKWPLLAGRVERHGNSYRIKVPLGDYNKDYLPFVLTSTDSASPITDFVELPLPLVSDSLPASLFLSPSTPKNPVLWYQKSLPLTYWHLTHFRHPGREYTCIGLTFSHGIFDGMGIASIIHALEAETLGRPWPISACQLLPGQIENTFQHALDLAEKKTEGSLGVMAVYPYLNPLGAWEAVLLLLLVLWQAIWNKAYSCVIMIPGDACDMLVSETRKSLMLAGKDDVRLSTGDVLTAWLLKTIYSNEPNPKRRISVSSQMCLRKLFQLNNYVHNCFMALPYPIFTIGELHSTSVQDLAYRLSAAKSSASIDHAMAAHRLIKRYKKEFQDGTKAAISHFPEQSDECLLMTNVINGRVLDINWTGLGGGKTIFRYKLNRNAASLPASNLITIVGKLPDGRVALEVILNRKRMKALKDEIIRLSLDTKS